jgi:uncharacterized protein with FMN-binding domain
MRRAFTAVLITIVATVLLVNFKARTMLTIAKTHAPGPIATGTTTTSPRRSSTGRSRSSTGRSRASATTASSTRPRTIVGPTISTRYGPVQVAVILAGGRLQDVRALQLPSGDGKTNDINSQAGPLLRQEAMAAQGASIDTISGASYTSDGYRQSLQAALGRQ